MSTEVDKGCTFPFIFHRKGREEAPVKPGIIAPKPLKPVVSSKVVPNNWNSEPAVSNELASILRPKAIPPLVAQPNLNWSESEVAIPVRASAPIAIKARSPSGNQGSGLSQLLRAGREDQETAPLISPGGNDVSLYPSPPQRVQNPLITNPEFVITGGTPVSPSPASAMSANAVNIFPPRSPTGAELGLLALSPPAPNLRYGHHHLVLDTAFSRSPRSSSPLYNNLGGNLGMSGWASQQMGRYDQQDSASAVALKTNLSRRQRSLSVGDMPCPDLSTELELLYV